MLNSKRRRNFFFGSLLILCSLSHPSYAAFIPVKVATGAQFTCALSSEGNVKCWGDNSHYNLATGDRLRYGYSPGSMGNNLPVANLGTDFNVSDICAGDYFSCAASNEGRVKCWGGNDYYGALGQGLPAYKDTSQFGDFLAFTDLGPQFKTSRLTCGNNHVCALSREGEAKCWGMNTSGQLGLGNAVSRGSNPEHMGANLPVLVSSTPIQAMSNAFSHTCAVFQGAMKCWGSSNLGQLGQESLNSLGETNATKNLDLIPAVKLEAPGVDIQVRKTTVGIYSSCALYEMKTDKRDHVKCWGNNSGGVLGIGDSGSRGGFKNSMGQNLPEVDLGNYQISDIQGYASHTCVLGKNGQVKCWGANRDGRLGLGDSINRGNKPGQMGQNLSPIDLGLPAKALSTGSSAEHTCAILINNQVKCWGKNQFGQLGYEDSVDRGILPTDMGEALPFVRLN